MPSPFPGVDPYLENPEFWSEIHNRLIVAIADVMAPQIRPKYRVAIEKRVYSDSDESVLVGIAGVALLARPSTSASSPPDFPPTVSPPITATLPARHKPPIPISVPLLTEVRESYLEIREIASGQVITVIEILSPKNKRSGSGRIAYETKRQQIFASATHLVEIDLLRGGDRLPLLGDVPPMHYYILVSRADRRPLADLYPFSLPEEIPVVAVPLASGEVALDVDLQVLLQGVYDRASLDLIIDYTKPPALKLAAEDAAWANDLLQQQGLRTD